jgi:hypothetical protein
VSALVERLDNGMQEQRWGADVSNTPPSNPPQVGDSAREVPSAAPVFLIRDVASELGVRQQQSTLAFPNGTSASPDIISNGMIQFQEALSFIELFVRPSVDVWC